MAFVGLQKVTADQLNRVLTQVYHINASGNLTSPNGSLQDIPGASVTFDTLSSNAVYAAVGSFDVIQAADTTNDTFGWLIVDGVQSSTAAPFRGRTTGDGACVSQNWSGTLPTAGSHTLKLQGTQQTVGGSGQFTFSTNCSLLVMIYEVV